MRGKKFSHIVNLALFPPGSDLFRAQPITVETMRIARDFAAGLVDVNLLSAQYSEDRSVVPDYFAATPDLDRSVLEFRDFNVQRKLPLVKDILDRAYEAGDADYIVYTNVDIGLLPSFYCTVDRLIDSGYDSFAINRRSIAGSHAGIDNITLMYADVGRPHMGYDCFVFRQEDYRKFELGLTCLGAPYIGKVLLVNQVLNSKNFMVFRNQHVTFHVGNDRAWRAGAVRDYALHNRQELNKILAAQSPAQRSRLQRALSDNRLRGLKNKIGDWLGLS